MNKKAILLLTIIAFLVVLTALLYTYSPEFKNFVDQDKPPTINTTIVTEMVGHITEVKAGSILVSGSIDDEEKVAAFMIVPETDFLKTVIAITQEQAESGESFAPKTEVVPGAFSDLEIGMLVRIKATENLLQFSQAEAVEINYTTYDLPF